MDETAKPIPRLMLHHLGAVQDKSPALPPQNRHQAIDAVARGNLRKLGQALGICQELPQTHVAILAAIKAPEEDTVELLDPVGGSLQPVLHDGRFSLPAW